MSISLAQWQQQGLYFTVNGEQIFYRCSGNRHKPVLLLIHGFPTASWDWRHLWPALSRDYCLVAADMPGFGFSAKPRSWQYSIVLQADVQQALLRELNIQQFHILAHDYGDTVAQELLARHAEQPIGIQTVTLLNGGLFPETHQPVLVQRLLISPLGFLLAKFFYGKKLRRTFSRICSQPLAEEELQGFWTLMNYQNGRAVLPKLIRYMSERRRYRSRWVGALQHSPVPLCLINGSDDPISGRHMVARYRELVGDTNITELEQVGHYPQLEAPAAVLAAWQNFMAAQQPNEQNL
ncbi:alpha/beta fold hydrolase [Venatoribacter cucullus]|uniref:Alpha/beta fold hydrolase n=1 Tax=Venatoribacter cucullus TaxID=2661630 RepID=A0A9X7UV57_9GAMM|nr:alpha/beta hydrolase [Venatoribacter cucullus]QQD23647.1 alpha/beta fold hydrolase [Venatoribacter cucullus]